MAGEEIEVYVLGENEKTVLSDYEKVKEILGWYKNVFWKSVEVYQYKKS